MTSSSAVFDVIGLIKKIESSWTSWKISAQFAKDPQFIPNILKNYDKFDKKVIVRILLALLGVEGINRTRCTDAIKQLLCKAANDKDEWISITAGTVHSKLFKHSDAMIEESANKIFTSTANIIIQRLEDVMESETASDCTFYFQPNENMYLDRSISSDFIEGSTNQHFTYVGKMHDFLADAIPKKAEPVPITKHRSAGQQSESWQHTEDTVPPLSSENTFTRTSNVRSAFGSATSSSLAAVAAPKKLEKLSIEKINEISKKNQDFTKQRDEQAQLLVKRPISTGSSELAKLGLGAKKAKIETLTLPPKRVTTSAIDVVPSPIIPAPVQGLLDLTLLFASSPLLTDEMKKLISDFFHAKETGGPLENNSTEPDKSRRIKLSEENKLNKDGQTVKEAGYIILYYDDNRGWKKVIKTKILK